MESFCRPQPTIRVMRCMLCVMFAQFSVFPALVMCSAEYEKEIMSPGAAISGNVNKPCSFATDKGIIDLWDVGNSDHPRFQNIRSSAPGDTGLYSFDPCYPFSVGDCHSALVCRFNNTIGLEENIGAAQPGGTLVTGTFAAPYLLFVGPIETLGKTPKFTFVQLECVDEMQEDTLTVTGDFKDTTEDIYGMVLSSSSCCPRPIVKSLSLGTVLIILFLCAVLIYLVGGILYKMLVRGASGVEVIPHISFWMDFPYLVKDGVAFVVTCGKADPSTSSTGVQSSPGAGPKTGYDSI